MKTIGKSFFVAIIFLGFLFGKNSFADTAPPDHITTPEIIAKVSSHFWDHTHFKVIGVCQWLDCDWDGCYTESTLELDEYLPDLIVSSYNQSGDNPWYEASVLLDPAADATANAAAESLTGYPLEEGHSAMQAGNQHADHLDMREVEVIGNPDLFFQFPFAQLDSDTTAFVPYYQSVLDLGDRTGTAELMRPESLDPFNYYIGADFYNHWGYEFPRSMSVAIDNDYKAAVVTALHAADIVTNQNLLHTVNSLDNSCGENCAVANVIEEYDVDAGDRHAEWEEVYPNDHFIKLGEDDSLQVDSMGSDDRADGNGNYVFVVWRHYQGCQQGPGDLIYYTKKIDPTDKR